MNKKLYCHIALANPSIDYNEIKSLDDKLEEFSGLNSSYQMLIFLFLTFNSHQR